MSNCGRILPGVLAAIVLLAGSLPATARAADRSPLATVKGLRLETAEIARVTVYFARGDREHAERFAALAEEAAAYFHRELGASFPFHLAVLNPEDWFVPYAGGDLEPYGMPWASVEDSMIVAPASMEEGVLIFGPDDRANLRRVRFVLLHEFGHLASKQHLHPASPHSYSSVRWFEEFIATYFAYAFIHAHDSEWAEASRREWLEVLSGYTPGVLSLDWGFMRELPPDEFARTYAWYQILLNLRAADVYAEHGVDFLRAVKDRLPWEVSGAWSTEFLLPALEKIAPGFAVWADHLQRGDYARDRP